MGAKFAYRVALEDPNIRAVIIIGSAYDKNASQETLFVPDCVKPGLVQRSGGWIPGGMEFNFPIGHHIRSMRPLPCAILEAGPERATALIENRCPRSGMCMQVFVSLRAGEARFRVEYLVTNPTALSWRWYVWNNVGMLAHDDWRMFSKGKYMASAGHILPYPIDRLGLDISWFRNRLWSMDSFVVGHREDFFGCYDYRREHGLVHVAPWREMPGKKCFTWGTKYRHLDAARVFNDRGDDYLEIQVSPMETQGDFDMMPPGASRRFGETWIPFRRIGGIEWANHDLVFHVREGVGWLYAAVDVEAKVDIDGEVWTGRLRAGTPRRLPGKVRPGARVEIHADGRLQRAFRYPLKGRQEPNARARLEARYGRRSEHWRTHRKPRTPTELLEHARRMCRRDVQRAAIRSYRKLLELKPTLHQARLELAEALWRTGRFDEGAAELERLLSTRLAPQARAMLARRSQAEEAFFRPVHAVPPGPARDLALAERYAGYGNFEEALRLYRRLLRSQPDNPRVHYGLALYYEEVKHDRRRALRHARRALSLNPGDRDLIIELVPMFQAAGMHGRVVKFIQAAPRQVRRLYLCQKMLARAYFELGRYQACWRIVSRERLFNWEGENAHVDTYIDCATVLLERTLRRSDRRGARRLVEGIKHLPANLGVVRRPHCEAPNGFWEGRVRLLEGDQEGARQAWRQALDQADAELGRMEKGSGKSWVSLINAETLFYYGMCALEMGDRRRLRHAVRLLRKLAAARDQWHRAHNEDFITGTIHELEGDFASAEKAFLRHIRAGGETRVAKIHLAAVRAGLRRGQL